MVQIEHDVFDAFPLQPLEDAFDKSLAGHRHGRLGDNPSDRIETCPEASRQDDGR